KGKDQERLNLLAKGFKGHVDDGFLQARLESSKIVSLDLVILPKKGYVALVEFFLEYGESLATMDETQATNYIAGELKDFGARPDDMVVRNIMLRVRELQ